MGSVTYRRCITTLNIFGHPDQNRICHPCSAMRAGARLLSSSLIRENTSARCISPVILRQRPNAPVRTHGWLRAGRSYRRGFIGRRSQRCPPLLSFPPDRQPRDVRLSAITVDPGITGYPVAEQAERLQVPAVFHVFSGSFAERYSVTMDKLMRQEGQESACRSCPGARRRSHRGDDGVHSV